MYLALVILAMLMSLAVGWSIGANDAANSLGTAVGSRVVTTRQALLLIVVFGFAGAFLQGGRVTKTIGKGIVHISALPADTAAFVVLGSALAAAAWVIIATYWKMPISTSHSIVGAVAGAGLAIGAPVSWNVLRDIFICWVATPAGAALLGYTTYRLLQWAYPRVVPERWARPLLTFLIIASGCYVAYSWGANDVANATGLLAGANVLSVNQSVAFGGLAIVLGVVTWGYKVMETVGFQITHLAPLMAFAAQLASAVNVHVYTVFGIPVSTSHSIVGAIFGVGLARGLRVLNLRIMREITICWVATPFVSGVVSFLVLKGLACFVMIQK